jgi:hypothetical protein
MIWEGAVSEQMVVGWTDESIEALREALDEMVEAVFVTHEKASYEANPIVRLVLDNYYEGVDS